MRLKMWVQPARIARLGALALATGAGCATPPDPDVLRLPPPPMLGERRTAPDSSAVKPASAAEPAATAPKSTPDAAAPASPIPPAAPQTFTPDDAVRYALRNNPTLASVRLQRGLAAGGVVIAQTYPFNPVAETFEMGDTGPRDAGITNHLNFQACIRLDIEVRGQRRYRRSAAEAAVTRTEWEVAAQEVSVSVATNRAFNTVLYRQRKLDVLDDAVKLDELVVDMVKKLVDAGRLRPADMIVARTELDSARALRGQGQLTLVQARSDLRRQLGSLSDDFTVKGDLDLPVPTTDLDTYMKAAIQVRPDLQARKAAITEAQARLQLTVADRYGNISVGPSYEVDNTSVNYIGAAIFLPIPVLNTHRGEIMQAQNAVARSMADAQQLEIQSEQEVQAAMFRLGAARKWSESYATEVLPNLRKSTQDMERLLQQNDPGVDVLKVIDVQRTYLRSFDAYLDALYEISQARADLAAAVGDPSLALGLYAPDPMPQAQPLPQPQPVPPPVVQPQPMVK